VAETSGFLTQYCGWHAYSLYGSSSTPIKYAFVGNPAAGMSACSAQSSGPNGDAKADAMVSVLAHEMEEAATDPQLNAWYDPSGGENADKCAWTFGATYSANGAQANMRLGQRDYLIQRNWVNAGGGYCALSYIAAAGFNLSVSPSTQTILAGQPTGTYTMTATPHAGWSGKVTYTVTGLPAGALAHINGNLITITTTAATIVPGTYSFTITGADGTLATTSATATLVVNPLTFNISILPASRTVNRLNNKNVPTTYTVTLTANVGYTGTVNLSFSGVPYGVPLALTPTSIPGGNRTSTLTVTVTPGATHSTNTLIVTGTDGTATKSASALLVVN
jgi:hypothetical protein